MTKELKAILKNIVKYDILLGLASTMILFFIGFRKIIPIFILGIMVSIINFIVSAIILDKSLNSCNKLKVILVPLSYFLRIGMVVCIALLFLKNTYCLFAYITGLIIHYPVLAITTIKTQKGSE